MNRLICRRPLALLILFLSLGGFSVALASLAVADAVPTVKIPDRELEPVILTGRAVAALTSLPADELIVYAHSGGGWTQIPFQVDEVTAAGAYTTTEDGLLDANDEIVFMARDLGDRAPPNVSPTAKLPISPGWYEIEVIDPLSPTLKGWAYLVHSSVLTPSVTADYVDFAPAFHRINAADYGLGFGVTHTGMDYLTLGSGGMEILDRTKTRLDCGIPFICPITEETMSPLPDDLIKDGPVRVIARGGQVLAYGSMARWSSTYDVPWFLWGSVRISTDFNEAATGAVYYSAVVTEGVTVDGITDTIPTGHLSAWWQLSTDTGTLIHVADTSSIGGIQSNYYVDNAEWDASDTGDRRHYGDTGVRIDAPRLSFTYTATAYFLQDLQPNVGSTYEAFSSHPLLATARFYGDAWRCDWSGQEYDDFYAPPDLGELTPERLGEVLRVEHIRSYTPEEVASAAGLSSSTYGAVAYRILYLSQTPINTPQAVSGLVVVPTKTVPANGTGIIPEIGLPVVVHGHGTGGMADSCAPSKSTLSVAGLLPWVAQGYLVSASDYVGLGTPGLHPYSIGESEAYGLLDSARAALRFCDSSHGIVAPPAANRIVLEGHSQGGHAALFALQARESYAPELDVVGTVVFAPGSEPRLLTQRIAEGSSLLVAPAAMAMYSYSEFYGDPIDLGTWLKEPYATEMADRVEQQCILGLMLWMGFDPERVFQPGMIAAVTERRWDDLQPFTTYLDVNTPGNFASDVPVLILQGEDDPYIPPEISERLWERMCLHGTPVEMSRYEGVRHSGITRAAQPEAFQWMADRLAGVPAPDGCPAVHRAFLPLVLR
jgi:pimeloyl-ACP methyl ester carboxylesterase